MPSFSFHVILYSCRELKNVPLNERFEQDNNNGVRGQRMSNKKSHIDALYCNDRGIIFTINIIATIGISIKKILSRRINDKNLAILWFSFLLVSSSVRTNLVIKIIIKCVGKSVVIIIIVNVKIASYFVCSLTLSLFQDVFRF